MKALVYTGPEQLEIQDFADPVPAEGEVLVRIDSVGICGSDMHAYLGHDERRPAPLILGHEAAGTVVGGHRDGERVTVNPLVTDGTCDACLSGRENLSPTRQIISMPPREGAFAQFVAIPERNLVTVPDAISLEKASLAEPIACGWHATRLGLDASFKPADQIKALVIGGGAIGLGSALSLRAQGVTDVSIVETNSARAAYLRDICGQTVVTLDPDHPDPQFDLVIDGVGFAVTRALACAWVLPGGVIMHIGLGQAEGGLDIRRMTLQEISFIGTYTYTPRDFQDTAAAIFSGALGDLNWFDVRPMDDGAAAFADIRSAASVAPKTLLKPWT